MPVSRDIYFHRPLLYFNRHIETVATGLWRTAAVLEAERVRLSTADDDFIDVDCYRGKSNKAVILSHGLEGSSSRPYIINMAEIFFHRGYSVFAWNYRGCSGEDNRQYYSYTTGRTDDLHLVMEYALQCGCSEIYLCGFSMGGNTTLKYIGDGKFPISPAVKKAVAISPPCDLGDSADKLHRGFNRIYEKRFLRTFSEKIRKKYEKFPNKIPIEKLQDAKNIRLFDKYFTGPLNGYQGADDFYAENSSKKYIPFIRIPTLIIQAANDPFLGALCYPVQEAEKNENVLLEITKFGGHLGFKMRNGKYYDVERAVQFIDEIIP